MSLRVVCSARFATHARSHIHETGPVIRVNQLQGTRFRFGFALGGSRSIDPRPFKWEVYGSSPRACAPVRISPPNSYAPRACSSDGRSPTNPSDLPVHARLSFGTGRGRWIFYSRTVTVTNSSVDNWPSLARTRSRYSPGSVNVILDVAVPFSTSAKYGSVVMFAGPRQTS